jgi:hypothetical protein
MNDGPIFTPARNDNNFGEYKAIYGNPFRINLGLKRRLIINVSDNVTDVVMSSM